MSPYLEQPHGASLARSLNSTGSGAAELRPQADEGQTEPGKMTEPLTNSPKVFMDPSSTDSRNLS